MKLAIVVIAMDDTNVSHFFESQTMTPKLTMRLPSLENIISQLKVSLKFHF